MTASLAVLGKQTGGRKIAVLGEMLELGQDGPYMHQMLLSDIIENKVDKVFAVGSLMKHLYDVLPIELQSGFYEKIDDLLPHFIENLQDNDIVLVKGSNSVRLNKLVHLFKQNS